MNSAGPIATSQLLHIGNRYLVEIDFRVQIDRFQLPFVIIFGAVWDDGNALVSQVGDGTVYIISLNCNMSMPPVSAAFHDLDAAAGKD